MAQLTQADIARCTKLGKQYMGSIPLPLQSRLDHRGGASLHVASLFPPPGTFEALGGRGGIAVGRDRRCGRERRQKTSAAPLDRSWRSGERISQVNGFVLIAGQPGPT